MEEPCPFCGFKHSGFRESHNWRCTQCGKDYSDWLLAERNKTGATVEAKAKSRFKLDEPVRLFTPIEIPKEAQPVKDAQNIFLLLALVILFLNFFADSFKYMIPVMGFSSLYHGVMVHKTGYAIGKNEIYQRGKNPIMYRAHLLSSYALFVFMIFYWFE